MANAAGGKFAVPEAAAPAENLIDAKTTITAVENLPAPATSSATLENDPAPHDHTHLRLQSDDAPADPETGSGAG